MAATPDDLSIVTNSPESVDPVRSVAGTQRDTVRLSGRRRPVPPRAPVLLAAAVSTTWAAVLSYGSILVVVGLTTVVSGSATLGQIAQIGLAGWLLGHGVPLATGGGAIGLTPLAVSALAAWRIARAGVHTTRAIGGRRTSSVRPVVLAASTVSVVYGLLGALAAFSMLALSGVRVEPLRAGITFTAFALVIGTAGALTQSGALTGWIERAPSLLRDCVRTALVASALLLGAGAAVAGMAIAFAGGSASDTLESYHTGVAGQAGITLLSLLYAPNVAVWCSAYLIGPGFGVGVGTVVSAAKVTLGPLPAVPVLAGLPASAASGLGGLLLGVPLLAGLTAGWLLARRRHREAAALPGRPEVGWAGLLGAAALAGPVAGMLLGLAAAASGGALGSGRLSVIGPVAWQVALVALVVIAVGAVAGAALTRWLSPPPRRLRAG